MSYSAFQATVLIVMLAFAIFACILYFSAMKRGDLEKVEKFDSRVVDKKQKNTPKKKD